MTIEQRKIALINWITNLENESLIGQMEVFRNSTLDELPKEIVSLLKISDTAPEDDCVAHTTSRNLLGRK